MNAIQIRSGTSGAVLEGTNSNDVPLWHPATRTWQAGAVPPPTPADLGQVFVIDSYAKLEELFPADEDGVHVLNELAQYFFSDVVVMAAGTRIAVTAPASLISGPGMLVSTTTGGALVYPGAGVHRVQCLTINRPTPDDGDTSAIRVEGAATVIVDSCTLTAGMAQATGVENLSTGAVVRIHNTSIAAFTAVRTLGGKTLVRDCALTAGATGVSVHVDGDNQTAVRVEGCDLSAGQHAAVVEQTREFWIGHCSHATGGTSGAWLVNETALLTMFCAEANRVPQCSGFLQSNAAASYRMLFNSVGNLNALPFALGTNVGPNANVNWFRGNFAAGLRVTETDIAI